MAKEKSLMATARLKGYWEVLKGGKGGASIILMLSI